MVNELEAHNGRHLTEQSQCVGAPVVIGIVSPGKLDQPAKLVLDALDKAMDPGCG